MPDPSVEACGRPAELLLVENNAADVLLTREAFRAAKISNNLAVAFDGADALRRLRREGPYEGHSGPDLVLLDFALPAAAGRELLQAIKQDPELARVPVVMLTSSDAEIDILRSYTVAADGYVVKPLDFDRLREVIASIASLGFSLVTRGPLAVETPISA